MLNDVHSICGYIIARYLFEKHFKQSDLAAPAAAATTTTTASATATAARSASTAALSSPSATIANLLLLHRHVNDEVGITSASALEKLPPPRRSHGNNQCNVFRRLWNAYESLPFEKKYILLGTILGNLPDLDVIISPFLGGHHFFHRTATHSVFGNIVIVPTIAYAVQRLLALPLPLPHKINNDNTNTNNNNNSNGNNNKKQVRRRVAPSFAHCLKLVAMCVGSHVVTDFVTNYGTQVFWPLLGKPYSLGVITVFDFTTVVFFYLAYACTRLLSVLQSTSTSTSTTSTSYNNNNNNTKDVTLRRAVLRPLLRLWSKLFSFCWKHSKKHSITTKRDCAAMFQQKPPKTTSAAGRWLYAAAARFIDAPLKHSHIFWTSSIVFTILMLWKRANLNEAINKAQNKIKNHIFNSNRGGSPMHNSNSNNNNNNSTRLWLQPSNFFNNRFYLISYDRKTKKAKKLQTVTINTTDCFKLIKYILCMFKQEKRPRFTTVNNGNSERQQQQQPHDYWRKYIDASPPREFFPEIIRQRSMIFQQILGESLPTVFFMAAFHIAFEWYIRRLKRRRRISSNSSSSSNNHSVPMNRVLVDTALSSVVRINVN